LEGDVEVDEMSSVLVQVLEGYLLLASPSASLSDASSPELTPALEERLRRALEQLRQSSATDVLPSDPETLPQGLLEDLLPDPVEDEDAFKGLWDTVVELHGREATKLAEQNPTADWKARCLTARVLLCYDFLTAGVVSNEFQ
jgi:hypothetical protein